MGPYVDQFNNTTLLVSYTQVRSSTSLIIRVY